MHVHRVGKPGRAWLGLLAGLSIGLVSPLGLCTALAHAQEGAPASAAAAGPTVVVTLQNGGKVRGALLEFRDGRVRLRPEGETADRTFLPSEVADLDFAPQEPVVAQLKPVGEPAPVPKVSSPPQPPAKTPSESVAETKKSTPEWPAKPPTEAQTKDEPKRPILEPLLKRRQFAEERRKKLLEFVRQRADELLTPDERKRLHELQPRENLTPAERKELEGLRQKLGLMDADSFRHLISEVMEEARLAQRKNELSTYSDTHMKRLRSATTTEERRRQIASLFAAAQVAGKDAVPLLKDMAFVLTRSTNPNTTTFDDTMKELRALYDIFVDEVERLDTPPPPRPR